MQVVSFINPISTPRHNYRTLEYESEIIREGLIGVSRWAETARELITAHAAHDRTVILEGERGSGKKLLARLIHRSGSRRNGPFVSLSLGATTDELARAALFGSRTERFDDPNRCEKGLAELAQGGTLYIEGLPEISSSLIQDILQLSESRGLSGHEERPVRILLGWNTRSGSCTHRTPTNDKTRCLNFERIQVRPLRERSEDIETLAKHFIQERCRTLGKELRRLTPEALQVLCSYDWPRNVSELRTVVSQLVAQVTPPSIDASLLPGYMLQTLATQQLIPVAGVDLDAEVRRVEVEFICAALRQSHGLQNKAAQLLRVKPTTLFMKIRRYGIDVEAFRGNI